MLPGPRARGKLPKFNIRGRTVINEEVEEVAMASLPARSPLEEVSAFLENYWSRNQVLRTLQFASALCAGLLEGRRSNAAAKFSTVSTSIASTRVILRLLDDLPVLVHTLKSWRPNKVCVYIMHLSMLAPTSPHPGQGGEFSLFGMADLPQGSGY